MSDKSGNSSKLPAVSGIPSWMMIFAGLLGLYCTVTGIVGLADPTSVPDFVSGADALGAAWAGRMAGSGLALLLALWLRNAVGYVVAFGVGIMRELGDAVAALNDGEGMPLAVVLVVLVVDVVAFVFALRAARPGSL